MIDYYIVIFRSIVYEHLIHTLYVSNVENFELTEVSNIFNCLGGFGELKVRTLRGREYLKNVQRGTKGKGSKNL